MKMDKYCLDIQQAVDNDGDDTALAEKMPSSLKMWRERWEKQKVTAKGNAILEARLSVKYVGFKLRDIDCISKLCTVHQITLLKREGRWNYYATAILVGFNDSLPLDDPSNEDMYEYWNINEDFFDCVRAYYEGRTELKMLDLLDADSDEE